MADVSTTLNSDQIDALTLRQKIAFHALRGLLHLSARLSLQTARRIGRRLGLTYYRLAKKRVHIARVNIAICFPELTAGEQETLVRSSFEEAGMWVLEAGALWLWPTEKILDHVNVANADLLQRCLASGRGLIVAIPHLGNWEIMGPYLSSQTHFACFYKHDKHNPLFSDYLVRLRSRNGTVMAPADASGVRLLYKHLKAGNVIGLLPDHNPTDEMGVFAPFFGRAALTGTLISSLARKNNAVVLTAAVVRSPSGFEIHFAEVSNQNSDDAITAATSLNRAIETCVRLAPPQFQWVYPRFARRPDPARQHSPYRKANLPQ